MKALEHASFPEIADRVSGLYNEEEDALLVGMLGQDYVVRRTGIFLHGQKAPEHHSAVIADYLFGSRGDAVVMTPWHSYGDFAGGSASDFRKRVEQPLAQYVAEFINRANTLMPLFDAQPAPSVISSDVSMVVRALPKVYLHVDLSRETEDFPAEVWVKFSNNADAFLSAANLKTLSELFKDRLLSLLRIY